MHGHTRKTCREGENILGRETEGRLSEMKDEQEVVDGRTGRTCQEEVEMVQFQNMVHRRERATEFLAF